MVAFLLAEMSTIVKNETGTCQQPETFAISTEETAMRRQAEMSAIALNETAMRRQAETFAVETAETLTCRRAEMSAIVIISLIIYAIVKAANAVIETAEVATLVLPWMSTIMMQETDAVTLDNDMTTTEAARNIGEDPHSDSGARERTHIIQEKAV